MISVRITVLVWDEVKRNGLSHLLERLTNLEGSIIFCFLLHLRPPDLEFKKMHPWKIIILSGTCLLSLFLPYVNSSVLKMTAMNPGTVSYGYGQGWGKLVVPECSSCRKAGAVPSLLSSAGTGRGHWWSAGAESAAGTVLPSGSRSKLIYETASSAVNNSFPHIQLKLRERKLKTN